jgi:hydroxyethylthiazole kinase-like uncharacterized protein yjeF
VAPIPVLTVEELREVESRGEGLMERAGRAVALAAGTMVEAGDAILVVAGPGNNGGDAWVAARHLRDGGYKVVVLDLAGQAPGAAAAREARDALRSRGDAPVGDWPGGLRPALVIDGLLGLGLGRDVDGRFAELVARINDSGRPVLAIDIPSGLDSATGRVRGSAVRATRTLTFIAHKLGLHTQDGPDHCGAIELHELGMGEAARATAHGALLTAALVRPWLPARARNAHKGHFGTLGVIGGARGMVGAALLAARAALLAGAGKVRVGLLAAEAAGVDLQQPELMIGAIDDVLEADVLVVGPGAGQSASATSISMFDRQVLPAAIAARKPVVFDADALNALAFNEALRRDFPARRAAATVLTPHPAEAARLLGVKTPDVQADRLAAALEIARRFGAHVVLKGAGSICAFPDGRWSVNTTGNPGLASGGSGDALAGMIGALLAQGLEAERALQYAVCLHGAAADALVARGVGPIGLTASEVALEARRLLNIWTAKA